MTNAEYVELAIDRFEDALAAGRHLPGFGDLAAYVGYSPHHLGRLFQALTGLSLGQYLLGRRLAAARDRLLSGTESCATIAQDLGWEDYSAFQRAFRKGFGLGPGAVRTAPEAITAARVLPRARPHSGGKAPGRQPALETCGEAWYCGLVFHMGPGEKTFHRPWQLFREHEGLIAGRLPGPVLQIASWLDEGPGSGLWIHCAVPVDPRVRQHPVMFVRHLQASTNLVFEHDGPVETLERTYRWIWEDYLPGSRCKPLDCYEFQRYGPPGAPITICLPVGQPAGSSGESD